MVTRTIIFINILFLFLLQGVLPSLSQSSKIFKIITDTIKINNESYKLYSNNSFEKYDLDSGITQLERNIYKFRRVFNSVLKIKNDSLFLIKINYHPTNDTLIKKRTTDFYSKKFNYFLKELNDTFFVMENNNYKPLYLPRNIDLIKDCFPFYYRLIINNGLIISQDTVVNIYKDDSRLSRISSSIMSDLIEAFLLKCVDFSAFGLFEFAGNYSLKISKDGFIIDNYLKWNDHSPRQIISNCLLGLGQWELKAKNGILVDEIYTLRVFVFNGKLECQVFMANE